MKIYTRGGDKGKTGIHGGQRVDKDDIRIEANGCIDELNSMIGVVRSFLPKEHEWQKMLFKIQTELMVVMSNVATPSELRHKNPNVLPDDLDKFCEEQMDKMTDMMGASETFILPGGNLVSAHLQLARTIARRSERRLWTLNKQDEVSETVLKFINRLSDLFFTMSRFEMFCGGDTEERWKDFLYKRKKRTMAKKIVLITGGQRSGKSSYAQELTLSLSDNPVYLATSRVWDKEHENRIKRHQADRGSEWTNVEEEKYLSNHNLTDRVVLIDCVTLWATNFFFDNNSDVDKSLSMMKTEFEKLISQDAYFIFVTNEIGLGGTSDNQIQRFFTDFQGWMNQYIASKADQVFLMVSGIPLQVK